MKRAIKHAQSIVTVAVVLLLLTAGTISSANAQVLPPGGRHFGLTYGQWSAVWWQWAFAIPVHRPPFSDNVNHPLVDLTGGKCGVHQFGPVWFLGGAFFEVGTTSLSTVVRDDCVVPSSKALFFPILNTECTGIEGPGNGCGATVADSRAIVSSVIDGAGNLSADVDGTPIPIDATYRVGSPNKPPFCVFLAPDDLLSFIGEGPGGYGSGTHFHAGFSCGTVDDGYYVMLAPLSKGPHTVHFHGEFPVYAFALDVTYHLTVE